MNTFGYMVEIDPYSATKRAKKRTAWSFCARVGLIQSTQTTPTAAHLHGR